MDFTRWIKLQLLSVLLLFSSVAFATNTSTAEDDINFDLFHGIKPFTTDGCSYSPDSLPQATQKSIWNCCLQHDRSYWMGGTKQDRLNADTQLKICIEEKGHTWAAEVYFRAARVIPFYWARGWPEGFGYRKLTPIQREAVREEWQRFVDSLQEDFYIPGE